MADWSTFNVGGATQTAGQVPAAQPAPGTVGAPAGHVQSGTDPSAVGAAQASATNAHYAPDSTDPNGVGDAQKAAIAAHYNAHPAPATAPAAGPPPLDSAPFTPYSTGPGLQAGTDQAGGSLDMMKPGAGEQFFADNKDAYQTPGMAETYASDVLGKYGGGQNPHVSNDAEGAYQQFQASTPANMDPYYDRQRQVLSNQMNGQLASRGAYGSSVGLNSLAGGMADIGAQQAKDEASYGLSRAGLAGTLARGADTSSLGQSNNELSWTNGLGGLAGQGESAEINRLNAGMNAGLGAQGAQMQRGQNYFNNEMSMGGAMSGIMQDAYTPGFAGDAAILDDSIAARMGGAAEAYGQNKDQGNGLADSIWGGIKAIAPYAGAAVGGIFGGPGGAALGYGTGTAVSKL